MFSWWVRVAGRPRTALHIHNLNGMRCLDTAAACRGAVAPSWPATVLGTAQCIPMSLPMHPGAFARMLSMLNLKQHERCSARGKKLDVMSVVFGGCWR